MARLMVIAIGLIYILCLPAFAVDKPAADSTKAEPVKIAQAKQTPVRMVRMRASGKVTEITDIILKIDRTLKGNVEAMEFALEKPVEKINVGDSVTVSYVTKDGQNLATRVAPDKKYTKKPQKSAGKDELKPAPKKAAISPQAAPTK